MHKTFLSQHGRLARTPLFCAVILLANGRLLSAEFPVILSADTEGHVGPCRDCPYHPGLGGLTARAVILSNLRKPNSEPLLLDAGNFLIGSESLGSRGRVMVAAYSALGYDAVNLSHHDFWFGKNQTVTLLKEAKFAAISANLLDDDKGEPLVRPYVLKKSGAHTLALIGVAQAPAGLDLLPHLKEHLAGIRIQPPVEALARWLPKAKAESDRVILLYYGSAIGLDPIREKFGGDLAAILVGGIRPEGLPSGGKPPLVGTSNHGRDLAQVVITGAGPQTKVEVKQLAIEPTITPSPEMEKVLREFKIAPKP
jgi:2',3'-cyclic-nucleotide 2'-phosphodiesterase (5'-nucleotidase family)